MSERSPETGSNGGEENNKVAKELVQVLGKAEGFDPVPEEIDIASELELLANWSFWEKL